MVADHLSETESQHSDTHLSNIDSPDEECMDAHEDQSAYEGEPGPSMHTPDIQNRDNPPVDPDSLAYPLYEVYGHDRTLKLTNMRGKVGNWAWELEKWSSFIKAFAKPMLEINNDFLQERINAKLGRKLESLADIEEAVAIERQATLEGPWPPRDPTYEANDIGDIPEYRRTEAEWAYWYIFDLLRDAGRCFFQLRDYFEVLGSIHRVPTSVSVPDGHDDSDDSDDLDDSDDSDDPED